MSLTFGSLTSNILTLDAILENLCTSISKAGISERFNIHACNFLTEVLFYFTQTANKQGSNINIKELNKFDSVNIIDGSSWKVPKDLKNIFPGFNVAGCKIQLMYDYKTGVIKFIDITKETFNDQKYSKTLNDQIKKNDLFIFDLGYSIADFLDMVTHKEAHFISRINFSGINSYIKIGNTYKKISILTTLKKLNKGKNNIIELEVYVGNKRKKIKVRLLAIKAFEEAASKRRRNLIKNAKIRGGSPKEESLGLCDWSFYMTNIPEEKGLDIKTILSFYPVRWSVEIFFKQFKSILNIHKTNVKTNECRLKCEVVGKAIVSMFISCCYSYARAKAWKLFGVEISFDKTVKYFKRNIISLSEILTLSMKNIVKQVKKMIIQMVTNCQKGRQGTRQNSLDALIEESKYYKKYKHVIVSPVRLRKIFGKA